MITQAGTVINSNGLLDPRQVAELLNVPISWVYSAAEKGTIPSFRVGKYRRFRKNEMETWLEKQRERT